MGTMNLVASRIRLSAGIAALAVSLFALTGTAFAGGDWNDKEVSWKPYAEGLAEAKAQNKPVCLIFYTETCPHCTHYSAVFHDRQVVDLSKKFVMIRIDNDRDQATSAKYAPDGVYIPRTFFLKPDGTLLADITEQRAEYKYFYDENDPVSVMRSMNRVLMGM